MSVYHRLCKPLPLEGLYGFEKLAEMTAESNKLMT